MKVESIDIAILGGGIAGLGAAYRAANLNRKAVIFESRNSAGGLLDNFSIDGFRFDHAVHLSFANKNHIARKVFDKTKYLTHPSDSYCIEGDYKLKHPVQNNLFPLPLNERFKLVSSFLRRPKIKILQIRG